MADHIQMIQEREYAEKDGNFLVPTTLGVGLVEGSRLRCAAL